jgi:hypothetical protein
MAPPGTPDDEIVGWRGWIGPGGSFTLWPVRARDRYQQGRGGCCLGTIALVVLGLLAAWALEHVVNRRGRGAETRGGLQKGVAAPAPRTPAPPRVWVSRDHRRRADATPPARVGATPVQLGSLG